MTAKNKTVQWVRFGAYIEECDERNTEGKYTIDDVRGISIEKNSSRLRQIWKESF